MIYNLSTLLRLYIDTCFEVLLPLIPKALVISVLTAFAAAPSSFHAFLKNSFVSFTKAFTAFEAASKNLPNSLLIPDLNALNSFANSPKAFSKSPPPIAFLNAFFAEHTQGSVQL